MIDIQNSLRLRRKKWTDFFQVFSNLIGFSKFLFISLCSFLVSAVVCVQDTL